MTVAETNEVAATTETAESTAPTNEEAVQVLNDHVPSTELADDSRPNQIYDGLIKEMKLKGIDPDTVSLDSLVEAKLDDPIFNAEEDHKGINYQEVLESLPDNAKKLLANMRSDYTRKMQSVSEKKRSLDAQLQSLVNSDFDKGLRERQDSEVPEFDPYNQESYEARIKAEVDKRMNEMMEPLRRQSEEQKMQFELDQFRSEHPDFNELKLDIAKELHANDNLTARQAYHIVKGKQLSSRYETLQSELESHRQTILSAGLKVKSGRGRSYQSPPKGSTPMEIYEFYLNQEK